MEENKKRKSIGRFFIKMFLIFTILDVFMMEFANIIVSNTSFYKYGEDLLWEVFYAILVLVVMLLFHNSYVFTDKKEKLWPSLKFGLPMLAVSVLILFSNIAKLDSFSLGNFINVVILCISVGFAEEFLCRGWLQNEFIERYGDTKKNAIKSIILASLVFGLMHVVNLSFQTFFETLLQIINACALGVLLGSIYYKTKNIWSVIFLHAFYDFAIFIGEMNLIKDCTYNSPTPGVVLVNCISILTISALWIFSAIYVFRKCNFPDSKAKKINNSTLILAIVISFILIFIPFEGLVPEYENYQVCYDYETIEPIKNYTSHFLNYEKYYINSNKDEIYYVENENKINEILSNRNYQFEFKQDGYYKLVIKNLNTNYEKVIEFDGILYDFQVVENNDGYFVTIHTSENNDTVYYSDYLLKESLSNEVEFLNEFERSLVKYDLPVLDQVGYVTFSDNETKYPFMRSNDNNYFIIRDKQLFLIKK